MKITSLFIYAVVAVQFGCSVVSNRGAHPESAFATRDARVQQAFLDVIDQALSLGIAGEGRNESQLKQRRALDQTQRQFATASGWQRVCTLDHGMEAWAESQCMAFSPLPLPDTDCRAKEWCLKFAVAPFIERNPRLVEIVATAIADPCAYARTQTPVAPHEQGGRSILSPGESRRWLLCDSASPVFGIKKSGTPPGVFLLSINRN